MPQAETKGPAFGHGFTSDVPIDRVEFIDAPGSTLVGAFIGLTKGEPSLGTVHIPDYPGPQGENVEPWFGK